jgi:hypothetical protein
MASSLVEKMLSGLPLSGRYARVGITRLAPTRPLESIVASGAGVLIGAVSYCNRHRGASISPSTPDDATGNTGFWCVRVANAARIEAVDSPTWWARDLPWCVLRIVVLGIERVGSASPLRR